MMDGGRRDGLLFSIFWPPLGRDPGRFLRDLTQQGASRRLPNGNMAEEQARGPAVPWVHVAEDLACAGTCGSGDALGAGGVGFRLGMGSVTRDDRSEGTGRGSQRAVRRYICASLARLVTRKKQERRRTSRNPLQRPLSKLEDTEVGRRRLRRRPGLDPSRDRHQQQLQCPNGDTASLLSGPRFAERQLERLTPSHEQSPRDGDRASASRPRAGEHPGSNQGSSARCGSEGLAAVAERPNIS